MASQRPGGVHFVGSFNHALTISDAFEQLPALLPNRLRRLPDGEKGVRDYFVKWQVALFGVAPQTLGDFALHLLQIDPSTVQKQPIAKTLEQLGEIKTGFDDAALESYALFKQKKADGRILPYTRFQVCLPSVSNVAGFFSPAFQSILEPQYEAALFRALDRIQSNIPHDELAIQIDSSVEFMFLEGSGPLFTYFDPVLPGVTQRLARFADQVAPDVELGFHLCYGDINHQHFVEPYDMKLLVDVANGVQKEAKHPIQWLHLPVPKARTDLKYFEPLKELAWEVPELYLGLVHANDLEGTKERIETARKVVEHFGVSTECGLGRTPDEHFESIIKISKEVSAPVVADSENGKVA